MVEGALQLTLPSPISCNRYWRTFRGRQVISAEARAFKSLVAWKARQDGIQPLHGPIVLTVAYHPKRPKKWTGGPVRRQDVSNVVKVAEDALQGVAFVNDSQVVELHVILGEPVEGGALKVTVEERCTP